MIECKGYSLDLDLEQVKRELQMFIFLRAWLVARFGMQSETVAQAAILLFRTTLHPEIVHIHVGQPTKIGVIHAPSFLISASSNNALVDAGFYRWRYASLEVADGQYQNPAPMSLLRVWGERVGSEWGGAARAALFCTTTEIGGKLDSSSFFLVKKDERGQWSLYRAWQVECAPDGRAWQLGNAPLSPDNLSGYQKLGLTPEAIQPLVDVHRSLIDGTHPYAFRRGESILPTGQRLLAWLAGENGVSEKGPEALASHVDELLFGKV